MLNLWRVVLISTLMGFLFGLTFAERKKRAEHMAWLGDPDLAEADQAFQERMRRDRRLWEIYHTNRAIYGE